MKLSGIFGLKKKYKLCVVFLFASMFSFAQNLVPNGSLDAVSFCPNSLLKYFSYSLGLGLGHQIITGQLMPLILVILV